jgi:malonyl-CoA O-methyltransferase
MTFCLQDFPGERLNLPMPSFVDKNFLCRQFRRAAGSYEHHALVQEQTADHLLDVLAQHGGTMQHRVLEIGCCTGLLTRKLLQRFNGIRELILNDLVPDFPSRICATCLAPATAFLPGDIESLPLPGRFDLIISSSTLHWLHDIDKLLTKLADHLNPGGTLAFSLYGQDNLREIKELTGIGLHYRSQQEIEVMLRRHFILAHSSSQREILHFSSPQDVLRHLRQTGVNALSRAAWNRTRLEQFCAEYRRRFCAGTGVVLTYHPLFFVASRQQELRNFVE